MELKQYTKKEIETKIKKLNKLRKENFLKIKKIMFDNMDQKILIMDNIEFNIITMLILYCNLKMEISISIFKEWKKEYERSNKKTMLGVKYGY